MIENILVYGITFSGVYAMLAVGFSLVFGVARILNLAHTSFFMVAAYGIYLFTVRLDFPPLVSILITLAVVTIAGIVIYTYLIEPVRGHESALFIVTIAIALAIQESMLVSFGGLYLGVPALVQGFTTILGVRVSIQHLIVIGTVIISLLGLWVILSKTRLGLAIRATAQDREVANLMGINVKRIAIYTIGIGVFLAAFAGVVVAPLYTLEPHMWLHPLIIILATVILGGLGSIKGSLLGAVIIAFTEVIVIFAIPGGQFLRIPIALAIMVSILIVRPSGLFGISFEGER